MDEPNALITSIVITEYLRILDMFYHNKCRQSLQDANFQKDDHVPMFSHKLSW